MEDAAKEDAGKGSRFVTPASIFAGDPSDRLLARPPRTAAVLPDGAVRHLDQVQEGHAGKRDAPAIAGGWRRRALLADQARRSP